ncbi:MAG: phage portal protein family protein [Bacteroidota bacterium]
MAFFDFLKNKKGEAATGSPTLTADQQRLVNMLSDRKEKERLKRVLIDLVEQTKFLTRQDIAKWRAAWQRAISVEYPNRVLLNAVYRDVEIDNHLIAVIGQISKEVLQKVYIIVDRDTDKEIEGLKKTLEDKQWFIDFCKYVIESYFWGYRLVEFGAIEETDGVKKYCEVEVVDADHVIPEHHVFVKNMGDHYSNGIDYTVPPYNNICLGIGNKKNLGLYNAVAPQALAKKNILSFWDKFSEIFGMPLRIGKTSSTNPKDRNDISEMLQKMGAAAWGMFPDGTEIEIKETTRSDAWQVYDKRIERANSEMSKAIVHQTMTTDNGSSKSQSETHLVIQEKVINFFTTSLRICINDQLIPFMIRNGFKGWEKAKFKFDDTVEYTVEEQIKIEEMLLNNFDIDTNYFVEKYNVPVLAKKEPAANPFIPANKDGFFD